MDSSRFDSSGNLSQASSQLSEAGQESAVGSELEESHHSYHSGYRLSTNGLLPTNGHSGWGDDASVHPSSLAGSLKRDAVTPVDKKPEKTVTG